MKASHTFRAAIESQFMGRQTLIAALAIVVVSLSVVPLALAAGDPQAGQVLARRWCATCHVVDRSGQGPDTAPPFPSIAQHGQLTQDALRAWLTAPHPPMQNLNLSRQQIDDIMAYLESLATR